MLSGILAKDQDVIEVNQHTFPNFITKDVIHGLLEYCWCIRESKRQHLKLI